MQLLWEKKVRCLGVMMDTVEFGVPSSVSCREEMAQCWVCWAGARTDSCQEREFHSKPFSGAAMMLVPRGVPDQQLWNVGKCHLLGPPCHPSQKVGGRPSRWSRAFRGSEDPCAGHPGVASRIVSAVVRVCLTSHPWCWVAASALGRGSCKCSPGAHPEEPSPPHSRGLCSCPWCGWCQSAYTTALAEGKPGF